MSGDHGAGHVAGRGGWYVLDLAVIAAVGVLAGVLLAYVARRDRAPLVPDTPAELLNSST